MTDTKIDRRKIFEQLKNDPEAMRLFATMTYAEVGGQGTKAQIAFAESVANRAMVENKTVKEILSSEKYYQPYRDGRFNKAQQQIRQNPSIIDNMINQAITPVVVHGSNTIKGATHNISKYSNDQIVNRFDGVRGSIVEIGGEKYYYKTFEQRRIQNLPVLKQDQQTQAEKTQAGQQQKQAEQTRSNQQQGQQQGQQRQEYKYATSSKTREQLSKEDRESKPGKRLISLDFNDEDTGKARGVEIIIPDDATPEERKAAEQYVQDIKKFFEDNGYPNYPVRGVKTKSQNKRGAEGILHPEPFFRGDQKAVDIVLKNPEAFARATRSSLGKIAGATFIPAHTQKAQGTTLKTSDGRIISETEFGRSLIPILERIKTDQEQSSQAESPQKEYERIPESDLQAMRQLKEDPRYKDKDLTEEELYDIVKKNAEQFEISPERLTQLLTETKTDEQQRLERIAFGKNIAPEEAQKTIAKAALGLIDPRSKAIDASAKVLGLDESKDRKQIMEFLATGGKSSAIDPKATPWCGAFVNASLQQAGLKSLEAKGLIATSYMNWGTQKKASETQKGDVVVVPRGKSAGQKGGHVGIATGETKVVNGQLYVKIRGGNQKGERLVSEDWYPASKVNVRRATENEFSDELKEAIKRGEVNPEYLKSVGYPVPDQVTQEAKREIDQEQRGITKQTMPAMSASQQFEYDQYMSMRSRGETEEEQRQIEREAYETATGKQLVDVPDVMGTEVVGIPSPTTESTAITATAESQEPPTENIPSIEPITTPVSVPILSTATAPSVPTPGAAENTMGGFELPAPADNASQVAPSSPAPAVTPAPTTPQAAAQAPPPPATYRGAQEAGIPPSPTGPAPGSQRAAEEQSMKALDVAQREERARQQTEQQIATSAAAKAAAAGGGGGGQGGPSSAPSQNNSDASGASPGSTGQSMSDESLCWV